MKHLTKEQRYAISVMRTKNYSLKEIAEDIGKDKSVISRELKRNCDKRTGEYRSDLAQRKYETRMRNKPKKRYFTEEIKAVVEELLAKDHSPEQIANRLKKEGRPTVSHERIYQHIWEDKKKGGSLYKHLRRQGKKYKKRGNKTDNRGIIKNRKDIDLRPKEVEFKKRFGDLEMDTIIGKNHKGCLLTINDRATGMVWISKLPGKNAHILSEKVIHTLSPIKEYLHTITVDNGKEFAAHEKISQRLGVEIYFAKPYQSWQRGANENLNGLIRQYFPKKLSFENITDEQIQEVQDKLNNRPRKRLGYLSPIECYTHISPSNTLCFSAT
tara:strand:+ start:204 stop:1184 length:981 start_codon:yes stop_codon:yes gene_type:complete